MPVLLPALPQPSINLPVLSQNPPMHADIIATKSFQVAVDVAISQPFQFHSYIEINQSIQLLKNLMHSMLMTRQG